MQHKLGAAAGADRALVLSRDANFASLGGA